MDLENLNILKGELKSLGKKLPSIICSSASMIWILETLNYSFEVEEKNVKADKDYKIGLKPYILKRDK